MLPLTSTTAGVPALPQAAPRALDGSQPAGSPVEQARHLREQFGQFFGETFYGQMIKAMRTSTDKPAYFHGGRAEEIFQGQLDQTLSEELTAASADRLIGPMFAQAFPQAAKTLAAHEQATAPTAELDDLQLLRRR